MPLGRLFAILIGILIAILTSLGIGLYFLDLQKTSSYRQLALKSTTESTAHQLQVTVRDLTRTVEAIARQPLLVKRLQENDRRKLTLEGSKFASLIPGFKQLIILPLGFQSLTEETLPNMGFADLEMARQAIKTKPAPAIHAYNTPKSHLAIARPVLNGDKLVGVVLAIISVKSITNILPSIPDGTLELRQNNLLIRSIGNQELNSKAPTGEIAVAGVHWKIRYWMPDTTIFNWQILAALFSVNAFLTALTCFLVLKWLSAALINDQKVLHRLVQDRINNKAQGSYPVKLRSFEDLISKIPRMKSGTKIKTDQDASEPEDLFDEENLDDQLPASLLFAEEGIEVEETSGDARIETPADNTAKIPKSIFRAYDIRGIVDKTLTVDIVYNIGAAIGSEAEGLNQKKIVVGRDGRLSSPDLGDALIRGLRDSGRDIIDLGVVPTPLVYFATHFLDNVRSGIMVTGSHNPPEYNGLKIVLDGETLYGSRLQKIRERIEAKDLSVGKGTVESLDLTADYLGIISDDVQIGRPIKVVLDCGNGSAGTIAPLLLKTLGCEVIEINCEIDGNFPNHHPDPSKPTNYKTLITSVRDNSADLGITLDGDGDRIGMVDSDGSIIWPDRLMMLFASDVLSREPGADIVYDVKCSRTLATEIVKLGGRPLMSKTGHSFIKAKIKETGAALGGEMSGHIFFNERWYGFDDGIYSAARLLEIISSDTRTSKEIFAELPNNLCTPELNIAMAEEEKADFINALVALASFPDAKTTTLDGLRIDFSDGWGLVRASNTTPSLVMRFEAEDQSAMDRIQNDFKKLIKKIKPDMKLPF